MKKIWENLKQLVEEEKEKGDLLRREIESLRETKKGVQCLE